MKPRQFLLASAVAGALSGAAPTFAGPLGIISGGAGAGAIGTLGGTLSGAGTSPAMGFGSMLGAGGQFQGAITPPNPVIDTAPVRRGNGLANSVRGRAQGAVEGTGEAAVQRSASALGQAEGAAAAAANAQASGGASATPTANAGRMLRPLRRVDASGSAPAAWQAPWGSSRAHSRRRNSSSTARRSGEPMTSCIR